MSISHRPAYVEANPHLRHNYRDAQCAMFGAARAAGSRTDDAHRDAMLDGINAALNRRGARRLISRTQLRIDEMNAITLAITSGYFGPNWEWSHDWMLFIQTVQILPGLRMVSVFPEPRDGIRAREIVLRHNIMHTIRPTALSPLR